MSALGDYIHLHTENYLTYGVAKKGRNPQKFKAQKNYILNRVKNIESIKKSTISELELRLRANTIQATEKDKRKANFDIQDKINKLYEISAEHTQTGIMGYFYGTSLKGGWAYTDKYKDLKQLTLSSAEIERRKYVYEQLNKQITQLNKRGMVTEQEITEIVNMYRDAGGTIPSTLGMESVLGHIQEAIQHSSFNTWRSHIVGEFGENLVAACADKVDTLATNELEKFLKQAVIGDKRTAITLDKKKVAKDLSSFLSTDKEGNKYYFGSTQDKVDVNIQVKGQNVLASVKNYYDASSVTLQSDVSLFAALAFLESKNKFGTHWLNMHAGTLKGANRTEADEMLKQEIAYEALVSGNPLKGKVDNANVFIYLDRKTGRVFAKSTKDLLVNDINRIKITPNINHIVLDNDKSSKIQDRITQVLMDAHQTQLHVSMSVI